MARPPKSQGKAQSQSPSASISTSEAKSSTNPSPHQQRQTLDDLLTNYLEKLDTYTTLRSQQSNTLARAHLQLAKANFHAPPGRRYGSDCFDGRGKASARVTWDGFLPEGGGGGGYGGIRLFRRPYSNFKRGRDRARVGDNHDHDDEGDEGTESQVDMSRPSLSKAIPPSDSVKPAAAMQPGTTVVETAKDQDVDVKLSCLSLSSPAGERPVIIVEKDANAAEIKSKEQDEKGGDDEEEEEDDEEGKEEELISNPLHQFGILVPQALRSAQRDFESMLELSVRLVVVQRELLVLEEGIGRLRDGR